MNKNNILGAVGLCRKAGKLIYGFDVVETAVKDPKITVGGVLLAADLSEKTKKEARFICGKYSVGYAETDITLDEFSAVLGKRTGVILITDKGFYDSMIKKITVIGGYEWHKKRSR